MRYLGTYPQIPEMNFSFRFQWRALGPTTLKNVVDAVQEMGFQCIDRSFEVSELLGSESMARNGGGRVSQVHSSGSLHGSSRA